MNHNENIPFRLEDIPLIRLKKVKHRKVDPKALARIRNSIKRMGLLEPLLVSPCTDGDYKISDGELRYDILMAMGYETAPCFVRDDLDIYTANYQVNHLTPFEEKRMLDKAIEVVDGKLIADVFGHQRIIYRLPEALSERLHKTIIKAFDDGRITRRCVRELAEVVPARQLEIFAMMQNIKDFGTRFVKKQVVDTPPKQQQSTRKISPWTENKIRAKSLGANLKKQQAEHGQLVKLFREYTKALMQTVIHCRVIISNPAIAEYLKTNMLSIYTEIKEIIESELLEKKEPW